MTSIGEGDKAGDDAPSELSMSPERMLALATLAAELTVERIRSLRHDHAWRGASRAELERAFGGAAPETGTPAELVLERAAREILPVAGRVDHPRFFAFVPGSPTWPGVLADFMSAGHNTFQGTWLGASGPSQIELTVLDWFRDWIGYPEGAGGLFTSGGSAASLDALVAAREAAGAPKGATIYMSDQSHSALMRAARIVGIRPQHVRLVPTDDQFRLDVDALRHMVFDDRAVGRNPVAVCATAGTTNTGSIDPLEAIADLCAELGIWMHVDAAYGGFAVLTDRGQHLFHGLERADSIAMDAHKWLYQPFEAGCLMVRDVRLLERAFSVRPEYLQDADWGTDHPNFGDRGLQLSRSFRALKVWMSIQTFGLAAFRRAIDRTLDLAIRAEHYIRSSDRLEIVHPASLGVVCFRVLPRDAASTAAEVESLNERVQARIIESGLGMMSSTRLRGAYALRLCILNHDTRWEDVRSVLEAVETHGRALGARP